MILNRQRRVRVRPVQLNNFLSCVLSRVGASGGAADEPVSVCLVSDAAMARMNRRYRGKHGPTDVLSFPISPASPSFLGDIAISPETARRNARRHGRSLEDELRLLILHGVLHLMGYDHEADHGEMARLERRLRRQLKVAGA